MNMVNDALHRMLQNDIGRLPVVSREEPQKMVGYFNRSSMLGAWTQQMEEEGVREHGWLAGWRGPSRPVFPRDAQKRIVTKGEFLDDARNVRRRNVVKRMFVFLLQPLAQIFGRDVAGFAVR